MKALLSLFLLFVSVLTSTAAQTFYVGTFTRPGGSVGIYRFQLEEETGEIRNLGVAAETSNPSFLALHPGGRFLYAVGEAGEGRVTAFALQPEGALRELNHQSTRGAGPTHLSLDHAGRHLFVANYNSGSVACLPLGEDGTVGEVTGFLQATGAGPDPKRQKGPHAHSIYVAEGDQQVFSCDLGLDKLFRYRLDSAQGSLTPEEPPFLSMAPGSGPRHIAFSKGDRTLYVVGELNNTVTVLRQSPESGKLRDVQQVSTLPEGFHEKNTAAEVVLHPKGEYLYVSNRGHDSIAIFRVDREEGTLTPMGHVSAGGQGPRFFTIDPTGHYLLVLNQKSNNLVPLRLDPETGRLTPTGQTVELPEPVCAVFVP